jgi:hypothetical protein
MIGYIPSNWYWVIAGDTARTWSSATKTYVFSTDEAYAAWCAAGGEATTIDSEADLADVFRAQYPAGWPRLVPLSVTPLQMRKALRAAGLIDTVTNYVATLDDDSKDAWEYATEIERGNAIIAAGATALNMTSGQVDDLFRAAAAFKRR